MLRLKRNTERARAWTRELRGSTHFQGTAVTLLQPVLSGAPAGLPRPLSPCPVSSLHGASTALPWTASHSGVGHLSPPSPGSTASQSLCKDSVHTDAGICNRVTCVWVLVPNDQGQSPGTLVHPIKEDFSPQTPSFLQKGSFTLG